MARKEYLESNQIIVDRDNYAELRGMEFRYLGYLRSTEYMSLLQLRRSKMYRVAVAGGLETEAAFHLGYLDAIKTMAEVQMRMVQQVLDAHPDHDTDRPGRIRKGQLCLVDAQNCKCLVVARSAETTEGCTSDDPTNHQGDTCPVHEATGNGVRAEVYK